MFFKKSRFNQNMSFSQNPNMSFQENINPGSLYNPPQSYEQNRLILEIKENRRRINNLAKRIVRLENYLRIRDSSDYSILDDETKDYW